MTFFEKLASVYEVNDEPDRADLVQTILITAFVAIASIAVMGMLMQAVNNKGKNVSNQINTSTPTLTSLVSTL